MLQHHCESHGARTHTDKASSSSFFTRGVLSRKLQIPYMAKQEACTRHCTAGIYLRKHMSWVYSQAELMLSDVRVSP